MYVYCKVSTDRPYLSSAGNAPRLEVNIPPHIAQFRLGQCNAATSREERFIADLPHYDCTVLYL